MKKWVNKIVTRVKQFRIIGYITIGVTLYKNGTELEILVPEMFLLVILTELASRKKKPTSQADIQKEIDNIVGRGRD
jgi:flagellar motor switch protein FliM